MSKHLTGMKSYLPGWSYADSGSASSEGWDLFQSEGSAGGPLQLQKIDDEEAAGFSSDEEAWLHVWRQAQAGSELHTKALSVLSSDNLDEYFAIQRYALDHVDQDEVHKEIVAIERRLR